MRLTLIVLAHCFFSVVLSLAAKGGWERAIYFLAYLAEETHKTSDWTVAPGCSGGTRTVVLIDKTSIQRCTFAEFLHHIWSPDLTKTPPETEANRPSIESVRRKIPNVGVRPEDIPKLTAMALAKGAMTAGMMGYTSSSRLMPGVGDYYDVLAKIASPIQEAKTAAIESIKKKIGQLEESKGVSQGSLGIQPETWLKPKERNLLWNNPSDALEVLIHLRTQDMEDYKITQGGLGKYYSGTIITKKVTMQKTQSGKIDFETDIGHHEYDTLDYQATAEANGGDTHALDTAIDSYYAQEGITQPDGSMSASGGPASHQRALDSARTAKVGMYCA